MTSPMKATCHCGAVELNVTPSEPLDRALRCDCSYCRRRNVPTISASLDGVEVIKGADQLRLYSWGTHTAKHYFCQTCGVYMYHQRRIDPNQYGVNFYALEGIEPKDFEPRPWVDGVNHPSDA
ncbi:MAG: GFA family protein [Pelagimonas sp.]|nr:GFA family protein [Pelagimonas sp.]